MHVEIDSPCMLRRAARNEICNGCGHCALDRALEKARAVLGVVAVRGKPVEDCLVNSQLCVMAAQAGTVLQLAQFARGQFTDFITRERMEMHHAIESIQQFEAENLMQAPIELSTPAVQI